ncbi:MAG: hypothetical protein J6Z30_00570 [Pyramidobacter sp.]|nr:hypothetical protein [Pyramidobacter sp.]
MKRPDMMRAVTALAVAVILIGAVLTERSLYLAAQRLGKLTAEAELLTERARSRNEMLKAEIELARNELAAFAELPLSLGAGADALKAALEQCALSCGAGCVVSAAENGALGRITLEAALRTSPEKAFAFLRETMKRREFFLPRRLEWRALEAGLVSVEVELGAFVEEPAAAEVSGK